ncbi:hypothetical protein M0805_009687 [Coniferiporia weirii]|nr:hypothetical protein M0805_009687 [Coniferiporia weirii]
MDDLSSGWSSDSSNQTADNQTGAGRTVGNLYTFVGRGLERQLGRFAKHLGYITTPSDAVDDQSLIWSSASSNQTADNLPGAGRIIGNCYDLTGRGLERQIGSVAGRLGFGPLAVAVRIQKRRKAITTYSNLPQPPGPFRAESKKTEKDCKKLIGYVRSNVASTKKQALDRITDLSVEDSYVRGLFKTMGAVEAIEPLQSDPELWIYYGSSLQNSSRKALVSLADVEINMVLRTADVKIIVYDEVANENDSLLNGTLREIFAYLYDPDRSFIAVRYFRRLFQNFDIMIYFDAPIKQALDLIRNPPNDFEWEEGDQLLACLLEHITDDAQTPSLYNDNYEDELCVILDITLRHMDKLPRTASSRLFQRWLTYFDEAEIIDDFLDAHRLMYVLLRHIIDTNNASDGDPDNLCINSNALQAKYPSAFLRRATCPADLILCRIAYGRQKFLWRSHHTLLESTEPGILYLELALYVDSKDIPLRERARHCASVLLYTDIYSRAAMVQAFALTGFATSSDFTMMAEETKSLRNPMPFHDNGDNSFYRHCDTDGNLIHIFNRGQSDCGRACDVSHAHVLQVCDSSVVRLSAPHGIAFSSVGHYPLLAGYAAGGKPAYIAVAHFVGYLTSKYCAIPEGTRPEDLRVPVVSSPGRRAKTVLLSPSSVDVYVLRHAPAAYAESGRCAETMDGGEGLDATGPFFWKPVS